MVLPRRVWAIVIGMALVFALSHIWVQRSGIRQMREIGVTTADTTSVLDSGIPTLPARSDDWADPRIDLNGNEIDDAVSDYRVDGHGEMYERHAPDTALLHLSAPEL
jgi:hypothetical protein